MRNRISMRLAPFALAVGAAFAGAPHLGCAPVLGIESDPQVGGFKCQGSIHVRIASDFSATATDIAIPHFWGIYDYLRKQNANGGVRGCPIEMVVADNKYDPAATEAVVNQWRATDPAWSDVATLFIFGTGPTTRVGPALMAEKKVIIPGSYAGSLASPVPAMKSIAYPVVNESFQTTDFPESKPSAGWPFIFFPATDYSTAIRIGIQAMWNIAPGRIAFAHAPKDGPDACAYCVDPLAAGKSYLGSLQGMSIGRDLTIPQTSDPKRDPEISASVKAYFDTEIEHVLADPTYQPVSWVWSGNSVFATSRLGEAINVAQQTIDANTKIPAATKDKWKVRVMANNWGIGETTPSICGDGCTHDNFYGLFPVPRYGDIQAAGSMAELTSDHDKFGAMDGAPPPPLTPRKMEDYRDVRYVQGYVSALMWVKAVEAAVDAGHTKPTGDDIRIAFETFRSKDLSSLTAGPITFTSQDHRPQSTEVVYKVDKNGIFQFVSTYSIQLVPDWLGY